MIGFFDEIPREIDDAALVDGCSRAMVLWRVLLPLVRPGMMVAATFSVIFVWNEFLVGLFIINSTDRETIPIAASALLTVESPIAPLRVPGSDDRGDPRRVCGAAGPTPVTALRSGCAAGRAAPRRVRHGRLRRA